MERRLEHQSPQFAVDAQFESFSVLKHACTRAALLDDYEFVPDKVDTDRYTLKCKDKECTWYLYATAFPGTDVWRIRKTVQVHSCHGIHHSGHCNINEEFICTEFIPKLCSDPKFGPKSIQNHLKEEYGVEITYMKAWRMRSKSSTVPMKKLSTLSPSTVKKFNVQTQGVLCNLISNQRRINFNICSSPLQQVQWDLLLVALCLVLMEHI